MTDLLIRNVDPEVIARIESQAARLGLSREEFLRREVSRVARAQHRPTTRADLETFAETFSDLADESAMSAAWS